MTGKVFVAMSGGVDSSTTAALLCRAGREVVGATFIFSDDPPVPRPHSREAAAEVAAQLGIEYHVVDLRGEFERVVVEPFAAEYAIGRTPNPCIRCNVEMKFATALRLADELGCSTVATGHYALVRTGADGRSRLVRSSDVHKDQSYFLYRFTPDVLSRLEFPLAGFDKSEVRALAREMGLSPADHAESMDACFVGEGGYLDIVKRLHPEAFEPGDIVSADGTVVGTHDGVARYTIGQRKGLGIAAPNPLYVTAIDPVSRTVTVGEAAELERSSFSAVDAVLHEPLDPSGERLLIRVRHGMEPVEAFVSVDSDTLKIITDKPVSGVAPGQSVVCYRGDVVVCGGIIR